MTVFKKINHPDYQIFKFQELKQIHFPFHLSLRQYTDFSISTLNYHDEVKNGSTHHIIVTRYINGLP